MVLSCLQFTKLDLGRERMSTTGWQLVCAAVRCLTQTITWVGNLRTVQTCSSDIEVTRE